MTQVPAARRRIPAPARRTAPWRAALVASLALALLAPPAGAIRGRSPHPPADTAAANPRGAAVADDSLLAALPAGTLLVPFENLEGIILLDATLRGIAGRDTTGPLVLDTGAGYLALDLELARLLGLADPDAPREAIGLAPRALPRLALREWAMDQVEPVVTVDAGVVRGVTDRPVLGLLGQRPLAARIVWVDYAAGRLAFIPGASGGADAVEESPAGTPAAAAASRALLAPLLSADAVAVPFRLRGDGKMLVRARIADPSPPRWSRPLDLIVDTGATKCVLFPSTLSLALRHAGRWPALRGLTAPTLIGQAEASIVRIPALELETVAGRRHTVASVDAGVVASDLHGVLERVVGQRVHGLIGYSLLKRHRVAIDYPRGLLWLDPIPGWRDDRPHEYSHVGIQLERRDGRVWLTGVAHGSPAARARLRVGDELLAVDSLASATTELPDLARALEGPPGTAVTLTLRTAAGAERSVRLTRRRLL